MRRIKPVCWFSGIALFLVVGLYGTCALGGDFWPPKVPDEIPESFTLSHPPVQKIVLGNLTLQWEKTSLQEVRNTIGVGVIRHRGDAGDSEGSLCYHTRSSGRIWLISGEMHTDQLIYIVSGKADAGSGKSADCPELPARFQPVSLNGALWIGTSANQLKKLFGPPSATKDGWLFYSYLGKTKIRGETFDRTAGLMVRTRNGKVVELSAYHTTTD